MIRFTNNQSRQIKFSTTKKKKIKKNTRVSNYGIIIPRVINEPLFNEKKWQKPKNHIIDFAKQNKINPTKAEKEFDAFLKGLNGGVLHGQYVRQHIFSHKWILDFFFPDIRLGIEIDGSIHDTPEQKHRDLCKEADAKRFQITLLRIKNSEVFGNKSILTQKLRMAWRLAGKGKRGRISLINDKSQFFNSKSSHQIAKSNKLVLIICQDCGHTKKQFFSERNLNNQRFKCSKCNSLGRASIIE